VVSASTISATTSPPPARAPRPTEAERGEDSTSASHGASAQVGGPYYRGALTTTRIYDAAWAALTDEQRASLKEDPRRALTYDEASRLRDKLVILPQAEFIDESPMPEQSDQPEVLTSEFVAYIESL
jgi:hypothetical protein